MHARRTIWILVLALLTGACASRGPALEQMDADALFQHASSLLERRRWAEAEASFQRFVLEHPNHPRVAEARFRIGQTFVGREEYVSAAVEFNRLAIDFPAGPWADDARFEVCNAYYRLAPPKHLHQEYSQSAIEHCASLVGFYPDSEFAPRAREIVEELSNRMAEKVYAAAENYARRGLIDSANLYFELVADDYPGTIWAPRALLRLHQSYVELRYEPEAQAVKERLLRDYPTSAEARLLGGAAGS